MPAHEGADDATLPDEFLRQLPRYWWFSPSPSFRPAPPQQHHREQSFLNFRVTATRTGKLWIGEHVRELANGCSRPRQITASWLGLGVETHDVCDRTSPPDPVVLHGGPPTSEQPRTDDFSTASHVVGCAIQLSDSPSPLLLSSPAVAQCSGGALPHLDGRGWPLFIGAAKVVSVASKKHNGWGHDHRYAIGLRLTWIALVISTIAVYVYSWVGGVWPKTFVLAVAGSSVLGVITVVAVV